VSTPRRIDLRWAARAAGVASLVAQQAVHGSSEPPRLMLAYPPPGVPLPHDNATVMFRYLTGDPGDPLDFRRFAVSVDGVERTSHFRVTADVAWGFIVGGAREGIREHTVRARICSVRGLCSEVTAIVAVVGSHEAPNGGEAHARRRKMIDIVLEAARRLMKP
jgi:hypothetical protein